MKSSNKGRGKGEMLVLIADDEGNMRNLLASILKSGGYRHFEFASDGQKAVDLLRREDLQIDMAFLDIQMPGFSGLEVMAIARQARPECACYIVSAHSALENVLASVNGGGAGFVVKPYTAKKIADVLKKFEQEIMS